MIFLHFQIEEYINLNFCMLQIENKTSKILDSQKVDELIQGIVEDPHSAISLFSQGLMIEVIHRASSYTSDQNLLLQLYAPIKIVGSIHGHLQGLIKIFKMSGFPADVSYLFLGNYIEKGSQSIETLLLLMLYRIKYHSTFFLLRGNFQSGSMTQMNNFYEECLRKTSIQVWRNFCTFFNNMPLAAVLESKIFCVHSGISPTLTDIKQIKNLDNKDIDRKGGIACDLVWSQPNYQKIGFCQSSKGVGFQFGADAVIKLLSANNLDIMVRSQQILEEGYLIQDLRYGRKIINLFGVPDFLGKFGNSAAVMTINENLQIQFQVFKPKKKKGILQVAQTPKQK